MEKNIKISIKNLSKAFDEKEILNKINLDVYRNEILTIVGGSGSGKSVFMRVILDLIEKDKGQIFCDGIKVTQETKKDFYSKIAVLFQSNALFDSMNIEENILFPLMNRDDISKDERMKMVDEVLESVGLHKDIKKLSISEISGGMQKRVALARTIITKPSIIFLDEPTSGLDLRIAKSIFQLIKSLAEKYKITFFIITHDVHFAPMISDRIFFLENGSLTLVPNDKIEEKFVMNGD
jgi:phospholipid/cholesterol/gamma-HCH transport system ATP-binding protein